MTMRKLMINIIWLLFASCMVCPDAVFNSVEGYGVQGEGYFMSFQVETEIRRSF
jgi:hypothetical protein